MRNRRGSSALTSGVADVKSHAPVRRDSRFRIGSMTKPFVATVVLCGSPGHFDEQGEENRAFAVRNAGDSNRSPTRNPQTL